MSERKGNAYGTSGGGDTSFRKKYDREEYAAKAAERESKEKKESKERYEAKLSGKKFYREPTPPDAKLFEARRERLNLEENLNKTTLVPAGAAVGKRGRGAGFYCDACDLTFKDSLQWVDHLNSKQHLHATGQTAEVEQATLEDVRKRLEWLREKKREQERDEQFDLQKRLAERAGIEEEERRERREKRKMKRKEAKVKKESIEDTRNGDVEEEDADAIAMARMMGFSGAFGTTKKS